MAESLGSPHAAGGTLGAGRRNEGLCGSTSPLLWVTLAGLVGFSSAVAFSSWLKWERSTFVLAHAGVTLSFLAIYVRSAGIRPMTQLRQRWPAGLVVGLLAGAVLTYGVQQQAPSTRPLGSALVGSLAWLGLVYGALDAVLLSVVPVLTVYGSRPPEALSRAAARIQWGALSLLASLAVTASYHLGFAEFRGPNLVQPLIGNAIVTLAYLLAGNPLAPVLAHVIMHGAAVLHGAASTAQLPPHY